MLKSLLEPVESDKHDERVYEYRVANHRKEPQEDLLIGVQEVQVDGVQSTLGGRARRMEQGIDITQLAAWIDDDGANDGAGDDVCIVDRDEVEVYLLQDRASILDGSKLVENGG